MAVLLILTSAVSADSAVVAVWKSVVERSWPFRSPGSIVEVSAGSMAPDGTGGAFRYAGLTVEEVAAVLRYSESFSWIGQYAVDEAVVGHTADAGSHLVGLVGRGLFDSLGTAVPVVGRSFVPEDHLAGGSVSGVLALNQAQPVVVLSHSLWTSAFAGSSEIVGQQISIGGEPFRVVGVMPADFFFPAPRVAMWIPLRDDSGSADYRLRGVARPTLGRLRPAAAAAAAADEVDAILRTADLFIRRGELRVLIDRFGERSVATVRPVLGMLRVGGWLFALAAAMSCAALRLSRAASDRGAAETRVVLGASRVDEVAGAALRVATLAGLSAAGAGVATPYLLRSFRRLGSWSPVAEEAGAGPEVLVSALGSAVLIATIAEVPAMVERFRLRRSPLAPRPLWDVSGHRTLRVLLVVGTSAATVALTLTTLLGTNARALLAGRDGYADSNLVQISVDFAGSSADENARHEEKVRALEHAAERLTALSAVAAVGYADVLPDQPGPTVRRGRPQTDRRDPVILGGARRIRGVSPGLFGVIGVALLEGRGFRRSDDPPAERVAVVDRNLVTHSETPVQLDRFEEISTFGEARVVGITEPVREFPSGVSTPVVYVPISWERRGRTRMRRAELIARLHEDPSDERVVALAAAAASADPLLRVRRAETVRDRRLRGLGTSVLAGAALGAFTVAGLLLAVFGAVGNVLDEGVSRRGATAVRRALGASEEDVVWEALRRTVLALVAGVGSGGILGFVASRLVANRVPWVETGDPFIYLVPVAVVILLGGAASLWSAHRAVRSEPWAALTSL